MCAVRKHARRPLRDREQAQIGFPCSGSTSGQLEIEKGKLRALYGERTAIESAVRDVKEADRRATHDVVDSEAVSGVELGVLAGFHQQTLRRLQGLDERRRDCSARIQKQREQVLKMDRAKQLLERLKQTQFEDWQYELNREIESTAGELFLAGWCRAAGRRRS